MKRIIACLLIGCMILSLCGTLMLAVGAAETALVTDKTTYTVGEPILVTAVGEGRDWVGLYRTDDVIGTTTSIYWYYVAQDGNASGNTVNIYEATYNNFASRPEFASGVPAGNYRVVLLANDGYEVKAEVAITIEASPSDKPAAPASAQYTSANAGKGRADGTVRITHSGTAPDAYLLRWANAAGAMEGYTDIAVISCTGETTEYTMTPHTLIPEGADRILVYAKAGPNLSDTPAVALLPDRAGDYDLGTVRQELQVMSDIHINSNDNDPFNKQFAAALTEITALSPNTSGVFINGDIANRGLPSDYDAYNRILETAGKNLTVTAAIGNHDFFGAVHGDTSMTDAERIAQFLRATGNDSETVYFSRVIDGTLFVFLGSEELKAPNAQLSQKQLAWLKTTLEENQAEGRPVFLFLHEGIMNTVAGTFEYQGWHGVWQGEALRQILSTHPEVIMFSGHSHWKLESPVSFLPTDGQKATHLNTASCAYLWDDAANVTQMGIDGSQGYYIYLYDDCIVFRGRSFSEGKWISSAQFVMDWDSKGSWDAEEETDTATEPETEPETESATEPVTEPATNPTTEPVTDPLLEDTEDTGDTAGTIGSTPVDSNAGQDEGGCASAVAVLSLALCLAAVPLVRKKKE